MTRADQVGRAAALTPAGRGAIAVVAAAGASAFDAVDASFRAANGRLIRRQAVGRIVFGQWSSAASQAVLGVPAGVPAGAPAPAEDVVVCRRDALAVEVHCHGGSAAVERVLAAFAAAGCVIVPWQDWLASEHGSVIEAAAATALAGATTRRTAAILLDQQQGALRRALNAAAAEAERGELSRAVGHLDELIERAAVGLHLVEPWRIVIAGRPNVGKSTLLNALVGFDRAIVFDQPGTTRDVVSAATAIDGWPVQLRDVAGLRTAGDEVEAAGVELARQQVADADLVAWVVDAAVVGAELEEAAEAARAEAVELGLPVPDRQRVVTVVNKIDRLARQAPIRTAGVVGVSALHRTGVDALLTELSRSLIPVAPAPGVAVPFAPDQVAVLAAARDAAASGDAQLCVRRLRSLLVASATA